MSEPTVDVLAVMDAAIEADTRPGPRESRIAMHAARAAVVELVEADREYDAAQEAVAQAYPKTEYIKARKRLQQAEQRRADALARFGSEK